MKKRVLSVGQCAADNYSLRRMLQENFDVEVVAADTKTEAVAQLRAQPFSLVLVNRLFDANGASGLDFIAELKADASLADAPVMLVSNHGDAQQKAEALGAVPGFGKAHLEDAKTLTRLQAILNPASS